jgi:hypothetical protein
MEKKMKKQTMTAVAFCVIGVAAAAFGAAGDGIVGGPHDLRGLSGGQALDAGATGRVCAYCHTPHHAATGTDYLPLWSRTIDTQTFTTPYASATIDSIELLEGTSDKAVGPTRLCMSCHDGSIAPDQHYGSAGTSAALTGDGFGLLGSGAGVGAGALGLSNDHPVGFDYSAVAQGPVVGNPDAAGIAAAAAAGGQDPWIRKPTAAYLGNTYALTIQDRLFSQSGKNYMTCATCHDVHNKKNSYPTAVSETVNYLTLAGQASSQLCLSCHIK